MNNYVYSNMLSSRVGGDSGGASYTPPTLGSSDMFSSPKSETAPSVTAVSNPQSSSSVAATDSGSENGWAIAYVVLFVIVILFCLFMIIFLAYRSTASPIDQPYYVDRSRLQSAITSSYAPQ